MFDLKEREALQTLPQLRPQSASAQRCLSHVAFIGGVPWQLAFESKSASSRS